MIYLGLANYILANDKNRFTYSTDGSYFYSGNHTYFRKSYLLPEIILASGKIISLSLIFLNSRANTKATAMDRDKHNQMDCLVLKLEV